MATQIFVNLPAEKREQSIEFFSALGFTFDPSFTDQNAARMRVARTSA